MKREMPDRILDDWSNLAEVVAQFRALGYSDTYILDTILAVCDIRFCSEDVFLDCRGTPQANTNGTL